jgi:hypothetical protein
MNARAFPLAGAAALGFVTAAIMFAAWTPRPARAQLPKSGLTPLGPGPNSGIQNQGAQPLPQPLEIRSMDATHFVVATREPRLLAPMSEVNNSAVNMLVTVVTYYTVRDNQLVPIEHVRVPTGYRLITIGD